MNRQTVVVIALVVIAVMYLVSFALILIYQTGTAVMMRSLING